MGVQAGYVYAIAIEGTTLVKIGRTQNVQKRLRALQTGMPHRLLLLYSRSEEQPKAVEQALHGRLHMVRRQGEWFEVDSVALQRLWDEPTEHLLKPPSPGMKLDLYMLGRRIAGTRTVRGWTQKELADRAEVTQATIARLEVGQTPRVALETIAAIAEALGVGVDYLIGKTPDREHLPDVVVGV